MDSSGNGEENESSKACRDDIIAMLIASGYHKARIGSLNFYNRIVGGIAWAITRYDDVEVAADLLYEESEDQNIKIRTEQSEKIIEALKSINCPYQLSAHQIFGLDFPALKNVIQWILRKILSRPPNTHRHVISWVSRSQKTSNSEFPKFRRRQMTSTTRHLKRFDNSVKYSLAMDAKCTLAEYSVSGGTVVLDSEDEQLGLERDTATTENLQELKKMEKENEDLERKFTRISEKLENNEEFDLQQIEELIKSFKTTQIRAEELQNLVSNLENSESDDEKNLRNSEDFESEKLEIQEKFNEKTKELSESIREIIALQFQLDRLNSTNFSAIYRKRNMERIQNSLELTQESKMAVIDFNVTCDILTFSKRITGFMDEVEKSLLAEPMQTQDHRDAFVSYMNDVRTQLGEYHWKATLTQGNMDVEKTGLAQIRTALRAKEREVANTTLEMKKLLNLNRLLQKTAAELTTNQ
ncbi:Protein CBG21952 [Caenorhabditis briggsae]|uniref:Protein CBG21952 n=1 Tax=Caenorhabditis briggsae TaxID=6238 RepID=A8Y155_CAEBR|nr:Protein CBG21952 [Caenorhabditis briggsae]CAP38616.2 Protein CBG21952 [Caenorhabditis briggsae]